jgi:ribosomal protection tetracycline resistance protein
VAFSIEAELGSMPLAFFAAVEDTVRRTLLQGLAGWEVTDCAVAMTHAGYLAKHSIGHHRFTKSVSSTGEDFRNLTPLVLMDALRQAGTVVCEPIHRFRLDAPADSLGAVLAVLARLGAVPGPPVPRGPAYLLEGEVPAARLHELQQRLSAPTSGEGGLETEFDRYQPVRGPVPVRPRTDHNPLDRKEYLLHTQRRV